MATTVRVFDNYDFGTIRTVNDGGRVLFCGKDVATALGGKDPTNALKLHCKGVTKHHHLGTLGGIQQFHFITESDLYRLVASSKKRSAPYGLKRLARLAAEQALLEATPKVPYYDVVLKSSSQLTTT